MKFIPIVTEFEADMQELRKIMCQAGQIMYKYDLVGRGDMSEKEYLETGLDDMEKNIHDLKAEYESRNKES